eukprot:8710769-Pyramimonas_sp.AAC.1
MEEEEETLHDPSRYPQKALRLLPSIISSTPIVCLLWAQTWRHSSSSCPLSLQCFGSGDSNRRLIRWRCWRSVSLDRSLRFR